MPLAGGARGDVGTGVAHHAAAQLLQDFLNFVVVFCCCLQTAPCPGSAPQAVSGAAAWDRGPAGHRCKA